MKKILFFILLVTLSVPVILIAGEETLDVKGESILSFEDAQRQAMRAAVEQALGVFIQSETEVENFELKKDRIFSRAKGYVTRYEVLKEEKVYDIFRVNIRATVSMDRIKDDLMAMKILLDSLERPKVMVLLQEKYSSIDKAGVKTTESNKGQEVSSLALDPGEMGMRIAETEISSILLSKGFELVDQAQIEAVKNLEQRRQAITGNIEAAKTLGLTLGAQYVITGLGVAQDNGEAYPGTGLRSIQASLQVKVIQTQTGLILGSVVKSGVSAHISPLTGATISLKEAARKAADEYLVDTITNSFQDYLNNGAPMKLNITGVSSFSQYKQVSSGIEVLDKVVSSKMETWNKQGQLLVLDMRFKGTSEELAEMLDGMAFEKGSLEVVDFAPERVDCRLK